MTIRIYSLLVVALVLVGCAASGPKFLPAEHFDTSTALIYVYRPSFTPPLAYKPTIKINSVEAANLARKSYFEIAVTPGTYAIESDWSLLSGIPDGTLTFEAKAGETYFVLVHTSMDFFTFLPMGGSLMPVFSGSGTIGLVDAVSALQVIGECKRIGNFDSSALWITPQ